MSNQKGGLVHKVPIIGDLVQRIPLVGDISVQYPLTTAVFTVLSLTDIHLMDILSIPVKALPNIELPHPLDLVGLPLNMLKNVASELKIPGRSVLTNKQQLAGAILQTVSNQGNQLGGHDGPCAIGPSGRCKKASKPDGKCELSPEGRCRKGGPPLMIKSRPRKPDFAIFQKKDDIKLDANDIRLLLKYITENYDDDERTTPEFLEELEDYLRNFAISEGELIGDFGETFKTNDLYFYFISRIGGYYKGYGLPTMHMLKPKGEEEFIEVEILSGKALQ